MFSVLKVVSYAFFFFFLSNSSNETSLVFLWFLLVGEVSSSKTGRNLNFVYC